MQGFFWPTSHSGHTAAAAAAFANTTTVANTTAVVAAAAGRYASFDYEEGPQRPADLTLLELLVNGRVVDALARLVPSSECVVY